MTTTPTGLADRAIAEARHRRATDPAVLATRDPDWPQWTYRAKTAHMVAQRFGLHAFTVTVTDDPDRRYGLRHGQLVRAVVRSPRENERYFAMLKADAVSGLKPDEAVALEPAKLRDGQRVTTATDKR